MDLPRHDLGLLLSLDVLLAERSVTRAARRLGISQPALSAQLARLRDLFDDPLLVRSGRGLVPTSRAEALRQPLNRLLDELQSLVAAELPFDPMAGPVTVRVVATDYIHAAVTGRLVTAFERRDGGPAPDTRVVMMAHDPQRSRQDLEEGRADLIIASEPLLPQGAIRSRLFDERFVAVQRRGHPRGTAPLDLDEFCRLPHVLVSPVGGALRGVTDEALAAVGRARRIAASVSSFLQLPPLLARTDLIAMAPERLAMACARDLDIFEPPVAVPGFTIHLAWHPRRDRDPKICWLRREIQALHL
ncbi:LysR family transcriptional regulator [Tistrella mobilis]|jgi:DNA-binding transcriptional LysR family regulator|uniref:LysR family transcriptional regulator n=1 Tax=Tistrella mobilis TaxID=171437 RepID=UPI003557FEA4